MTDSRDQPELETLSYKPVSAPPAVQGKNIPVIMPEMRVNSGKVAGQHPELPKPLKRGFLGLMANVIKPGPECQPEQPNKSLMIISEIEGLMSQVNEKLVCLQIAKCHLPPDSSDYKLIIMALEEIDLFQKTTLFELRKAFE